MYDKVILILIMILIVCILMSLYYTYQHHPLRITTPNPTTKLETFITVQESQSNYDNYLNLMNQLNQLDTNIINTSAVAAEFIKNNPVYDPSISYNNYKNITDYMNSFNDKTADAQFYIDQVVKEQKLLMLEKQLEDLSNNPNLATFSPDSNMLSSIKNPYTGANLNMEPVGNKNLVYINGKCLSFDGAAEYSLKDCRSDDPTQLFNTSIISNYNDYNSTIPDSLSQFRLENADELDNLSAFAVVSPSTDKTSCLTINSGNITVEPCNLSVFQRWNTSNKQLPC